MAPILPAPFPSFLSFPCLPRPVGRLAQEQDNRAVPLQIERAPLNKNWQMLRRGDAINLIGLSPEQMSAPS